MKIKKTLIVAVILLHLFFYVSALKTHTFDYFFPWGNVHDHQGIDFYQVPNGARMFMQGGNLTGESISSINTYAYGNRNVYHPFFTLLVGTPLQLLTPQTAFTLWLVFHGCLWFFLAWYLYQKFKSNKNITLALVLFLGLFPHYLEIWNGQYHFLYNAAIFFLLLASLQQEKWQDGLAFVSSLLVKPISLLFIPALILRKRWKTLLLGLSLFAVTTIFFILNRSGMYYLNNLFDRVSHPIGGPPGIFTLDAVLRFLAVPLYNTTLTKVVVALGIVFVSWRLRLNLFVQLFLWTSFYLLFYDLVFEYHYTTLAPFLAIGILTQKALQTRIAKVLSLTYVLPTPFFLFHLWQFQAVGQSVTDAGWVILVLFRILPLMILDYVVIFRSRSTYAL